jgi:hypothetical protein
MHRLTLVLAVLFAVGSTHLEATANANTHSRAEIRKAFDKFYGANRKARIRLSNGKTVTVKQLYRQVKRTLEIGNNHSNAMVQTGGGLLAGAFGIILGVAGYRASEFLPGAASWYASYRLFKGAKGVFSDAVAHEREANAKRDFTRGVVLEMAREAGLRKTRIPLPEKLDLPTEERPVTIGVGPVSIPRTYEQGRQGCDPWRISQTRCS